MSEENKLKQSRNVLRNLLGKYCESYISTLFAQTLSVNSVLRREKANDGHLVNFVINSYSLDGLRVKIHNTIQEFFDIDRNSDKEKELNQILASLGSRIDLPLPEHRNIGVPHSPNSVSEEELTENFNSYVEKFGEKLCHYLIKWAKKEGSE